ncbi:metallophosphoesterase family protein [Kurthia sibirica]|nr:metallophosphoesterase family protein [Kurthia sibirica]GEK35015.1 DeoR family transcriptional regulator [Kurthia sibirica]
MKIAVLYDILGNYFALEAVLKEIEHQNIDVIIVGGNIVWGPHPLEVLDLLRQCPIKKQFIRGNTERELFNSSCDVMASQGYFSEMYTWCLSKLTAQDVKWLGAMQSTFVYENILFVHASPRSDTEGIRKTTADAEISEMLKNVQQEIVVCGHTYRQFTREIGNQIVVNAGSVGLQMDSKGACWLMIDDAGIQFMETDYNFEIAAMEMMHSHCPRRQEFASHLLESSLE